MGFFSNLFGPRKVEVIINVPAIQIYVTKSESTSESEKRDPLASSGSGQANVEGRSQQFIVPKPPADDGVDEELANKFKNAKSSEVKFGQERTT